MRLPRAALTEHDIPASLEQETLETLHHRTRTSIRHSVVSSCSTLSVRRVSTQEFIDLEMDAYRNNVIRVSTRLDCLHCRRAQDHLCSVSLLLCAAIDPTQPP